MPGLFHTVTLPVNPAASRSLSWPAQDPRTRRTLVLDCTAWLADAGTTITQPAVVLSDPALVAGAVTCDGNLVSVVVAGGQPGTAPTIGIYVPLASGDHENIVVACPILPLPGTVPAGAVLSGSLAITDEFAPIDVSQMAALPGGALPTDQALVCRAGVPVGLLSVAALLAQAQAGAKGDKGDKGDPGVAGPGGGAASNVENTYVASGAIAPTDDIAYCTSPTAQAMTLALGAVGGHVVTVKRMGAGPVALAALIDGTQQTVTLASSSVKEALALRMSIALNSYILI